MSISLVEANATCRLLMIGRFEGLLIVDSVRSRISRQTTFWVN